MVFSPTRVLAFWNTWFSISMLDFVIGEADDLTASSLKNVDVYCIKHFKTDIKYYFWTPI